MDKLTQLMQAYDKSHYAIKEDRLVQIAVDNSQSLYQRFKNSIPKKEEVKVSKKPEEEPKVTYNIEPIKEAVPAQEKVNPLAGYKANRLKLSNKQKETANKIRNHFKSKYNFTDEQISGIVGVLFTESGLDPNIRRKGGTDSGLAQWVGPRLKEFKKIYGKEVIESTVDEQLDFMDYELRNSYNIVDKIKEAKTPEEAADVWLRGYENGGYGKLASVEQIEKAYKKYYPDKESVYHFFLKDRAQNALGFHAYYTTNPLETK